ncbi:MAG TPA: PilZ domain-containing protein [Vicinamibacteria bacterium]|jgi:hypothetical protein
MGVERRRDPRVPLVREVECTSHGLPLRARLAEISAGGAFLEVLAALPELLVLTFRLEPGEEPLTVGARVLYVQEGIGAGCQFLDVTPDERRRLAEFVARQETPEGREARRRGDRVTVYLPVTLSGVDASGQPFEESGAIITLSRNGAALSLSQRPPMGSHLHLRAGTRSFRGAVVWVQDAAPGLEVQVGIQSRGLSRSFGFDFPPEQG